MTSPIPADVLLRSYDEALAVHRRDHPTDDEQWAMTMAAFRHGVPLDRVRELVVFREFGMFSG